MNHDDINENDDHAVNNKDQLEPQTPDENGEKDDFDRCLFTFSLVNSYGSSELDKITDDDKPIKLTSE